MNKEIKRKWLAALRSGEYKQGTNMLCNMTDDQPKYCCLGVLTDLYIKEHSSSQKWEIGYFEDIPCRKTIDYDGYAMFFLPIKVRQWAEMTSMDPSVEGLHDGLTDTCDLSQWNDDYLKSFDEIADMIENNL